MIETIPSTRAGRWGLLTALVKRWRRPLTGPDGYSQGCVDDAERRLRIQVPLTLREWYRLAGNRKDLWSEQDESIPPNRLEVDDVLTIYVENQSVVRWGIRRGDLDEDDPPVFVSDVDDRSVWHLENGSVTEFALQMFASNLKWSRHNRCDANGAGNLEALRVIAASYRRLPFPDWHWPAWPTRLYGNDDIVIEHNGTGDDAWLWVCARTEEAFRMLESLVLPTGLQWESSSG